MKKTILSVILLFSVGYVAAQKKMSYQGLVHIAVREMFQALADNDTEKLKSYCTSDILILENGLIWNLDTLLHKMNQIKAEDFNRINTFKFVNTHVKRKVAWTTYYNKAEVINNGKQGLIKWLETAILVREKKTWKIKTLHSTLIHRS